MYKIEQEEIAPEARDCSFFVRQFRVFAVSEVHDEEAEVAETRVPATTLRLPLEHYASQDRVSEKKHFPSFTGVIP